MAEPAKRNFNWMLVFWVIIFFLTILYFFRT